MKHDRGEQEHWNGDPSDCDQDVVNVVWRHASIPGVTAATIRRQNATIALRAVSTQGAVAKYTATMQQDRNVDPDRPEKVPGEFLVKGINAAA